jgi:hypothetical protein
MSVALQNPAVTAQEPPKFHEAKARIRKKLQAELTDDA